MPPQPGDAIRLNVTSAVTGYLSLYQIDLEGALKQLFPVADQGLLVTANATQTIPDEPIVVTDVEQKFRITLIPVGQAPLTLDITIGPAKIP